MYQKFDQSGRVGIARALDISAGLPTPQNPHGIGEWAAVPDPKMTRQEQLLRWSWGSTVGPGVLEAGVPAEVGVLAEVGGLVEAGRLVDAAEPCFQTRTGCCWAQSSPDKVCCKPMDTWAGWSGSAVCYRWQNGSAPFSYGEQQACYLGLLVEARSISFRSDASGWVCFLARSFDFPPC